MAKASDVKINIEARMTCFMTTHLFDVFNDRYIFCKKCGMFRAAPQPSVPVTKWWWEYPGTSYPAYPHSPTITWSTTTTTSDTSSL